MKIPKYIETTLNKRVKSAENFHKYDLIISEFLDKKGIQVDEIHIRGGCESIVNPYGSCDSVREAIKKA